MKKASVKFLLTCLCMVMLVTSIPFNSEAAMYGYVDDSIKNIVFDASYYYANHEDVANALGNAPSDLYWHYANYGVVEGRMASPVFDIKDYVNLNSDLKNAFGTDYARGIKHFAGNGLAEGHRITTNDISNIGTGFEGRIMLNGTDLCLSISSTGNVELATKALNDTKQLWKFERETSGEYVGQYKITNLSTGKVLDLASARKANGTNIQTYASNDSEAQRWSFYEKVDGVYAIGLYKGSGRVLDVAGGVKKAGSNIQFYSYNGTTSQFFKIEKKSDFEQKSPVDLGSEVYANIVGLGSGLNIGYSGTNAKILTVDNTCLEQLWKLSKRSDGAYYIINMRCGKVLEVKDGSSNSGASVQLASQNGSDKQAWYIYSVNGVYVFVPKCASNCVLDVKNGLTTSGASLQTYTYNGTTAQLFSISKNDATFAKYEANGLEDDFYATITGVNSGNNLTLSGSSVVLGTPSEESEQIWHFKKNSNNTYTITNMGTGKVLDVKGASTSNSTAVQVYASNGTQAQRWYIYKVADNFVFVPEISQGSALNVSSNFTAVGTPLNIFQSNHTTAQYFQLNIKEGSFLDFVQPADIGTNFYANLQIGSYHLGVSGSNVQLATSGNGSYWKFERQSNGSYKITDAGSGKALDIKGGIICDGSNIQVYQSNDSLAQRWWIYQVGDQIIIASAKDSSFVADLSGNILTNGRNIQLYTYNDTPAQRFKIVNKTDKVLSYYVASPYNTNRIGSYSSLQAAKSAANSRIQYGYVVFNSLGQVVYTPSPNLAASKIVWNAKVTADYVRDNKYTYGDAKGNPYYNRSERVVSCDRFVGFALANAGYLANQPSTRGTPLFGTYNNLGAGSLENFLISHGFIKITNINNVKAGDIIFVGYSYNDLGLSPQYRHYPKHVFIAASGYAEGGGYTYRYDCGSLARIRSTQPSHEALSQSNNQFRFAYRATK